MKEICSDIWPQTNIKDFLPDHLWEFIINIVK